MRRIVIVLLCSCLAESCKIVPRTEQLAPTAKPSAGSGYIAGHFSRTEGGEYAFVIRGDDGSERNVAFDGTASRTERTGITAVPPGTYHVTGWYHELSSTGPEAPKKEPIGYKHPFGRPFQVEAGHVVFLGSFDATGTLTARVMRGKELKWNVRSNTVPADEVVRIVERVYPAFADLPMECVLCVPPADATAKAALPAKLPAVAPGTKAVLHLHRSDGAYQGWRLWAWETALPWSNRWDSFQGQPPGGMRTLAAFSNEHPAPPSGTDDFGVYWELDAGQFRDSRVNFVLVQPGARASLEQQQFWVLLDTKEAWVNADDGGVYWTRGDAERNWPE